MNYFDPDKFGVCGEPEYSVVRLPGLPYSDQGVVRQVDVFDNREDTIRCVTFTLREVALAGRTDEHVVSRLLHDHKLPVPVYPARTIRPMPQGGQAFRWRAVYLYPEGAELVGLLRAILSPAVRVTSADRSTWAERAKTKIRTIRQIVGERTP